LTNSYEIFEGWDVSLTTNHSNLVLIQITIQMQEFFNGIH